MSKYLYDNTEFTQDDIQIAADKVKLSFDDYLLEHPEIEQIEIPGPGDPKKDKKKNKDFHNAPTTSTLDFLLSKYSDIMTIDEFEDPKYTISDYNTDFNTRLKQEIKPAISDTYSNLNKDIELEAEIDEDANKSIQDLLKKPNRTKEQRKIAHQTEKILKDIQGYRLDKGQANLDIKGKHEYINDPISGKPVIEGKFLVKTDRNGEQTYFNLTDIINENFNLLENLNQDFDVDELIEILGDNYSIFDNTQAPKTPPKKMEVRYDDNGEPYYVMADLVTVEVAYDWKKAQLQNIPWTKWFDGAINSEVFDDEENEAAYTLSYLLPSEF